MGMNSPANAGRFLTIDEIPLAEKAADVQHLEIARRNGIEWHLKCTAPSPERRGSSHYDYGPCTHFLSKAYFDEAKAPFRDICIIFNGLDETPHQLDEHELFGFYDALGKTLAGQGMLAILLPAPFHLNRSLPYKESSIAQKLRDTHRSRFRDFTRPSNAMIKAPHNLYLNHYQSFRELISLCRSIAPSAFENKVGEELSEVCATRSLLSEETSEYLRQKISPDARFSLLGYSMGGLRVMTAFCFVWEKAVRCEEAPLFSSCVAINSGGSFSSMNVPTWVDPGEWSEMVRSLNLDHFRKKLKNEFPDEQRTFKSYSKAIRDVTLGNALKIRDLEQRDATFTRRLLFILGGGDDIMSMRSLNRITPPGGLNIFQVAGVGHMFRHGQWGTQLGGMLDHVANFVSACSKEGDRLDSKDIVEFLSLIDWRLNILPYDSGGRRAEDVIRDAMNRLEEDHEKNGARVAATLLIPVEDQTPDGVGQEWLKKAYKKESARRISNSAFRFVNRLLLELQTRISAGDCHPGMYRQARRSLLLGWLISKDKNLVKHWSSLADASDGQKFGDMLEEKGIVPRHVINSKLAAQQSLLDGIRRRMLRVFGLACKEDGFLLPSPEDGKDADG